MRTHPVNVTHLVVGLVFLGIAGSWALRESGTIDRDGFQWLLPLILVVAGAAGLVASVAKGLSKGSSEPSEDPGYDAGYEAAYDAGHDPLLDHGDEAPTTRIEHPAPAYDAEREEPPRT